MKQDEKFISTPEDYIKLFEGKNPSDELKIEKAYDFAVRSREFEIELYWKRSVYYWTFIAAIFAGYFVTHISHFIIRILA